MFGSHLSIAGGLHNALLTAARLHFSTVQIFTKSPQQLLIAKPLSPESIATFRSHATRLNFPTIVAHDSYLINLASPDPAKWQQSKSAFSEEIQRCNQLNIQFLVTHPGAHLGTGETAGIARITQAYNDILADLPEKLGGDGVTVCIESTAGQGTCLGHRFEHLRDILAGLHRPERFAICLDTAHLLAAGYDITTADKTRRVLDDFDRIVGNRHLHVFHLNDSKKPLASRVDRHDHLGRGHVGLPAFSVITTDPRFTHIPKILETPKDSPTPRAEDGREWDTINLEILLQLSRGQTPTLPKPTIPPASAPSPQKIPPRPSKKILPRKKTKSPAKTRRAKSS